MSSGTARADRTALARRGGDALGVLDGVEDPIAAAVRAEPGPAVTFSAPQALDRICRAFGEVVDIKTPLHHGHCTGVASLAAAAAKRCGLAADELLRCGPLAPIAQLAGMHHERLDGSGYHRGASAGASATRSASWPRPTCCKR